MTVKKAGPSKAAMSTPAPTSVTAKYPHIVHNSVHTDLKDHTDYTTHEDHTDNDHTTLLRPVHIFKLAYAVALAGRFSFELERFLDAVRCDAGPPVATRPATDTAAFDTYRDTCVLAQGFYQVSSAELPLHQRIDRIWYACRTFFFRGMITTVDAHGLPCDPSAPPEPVPAADWAPTFSAADIPALLAPRCYVHLLSTASDNALFVWASAGCLLGKHCVNVAEMPFDTLGLADVTDAVAQLEARLQHQDRLRREDPTATVGPRKRVWCPVMVHGPPDKIIVDLYERLDQKEQQYRALLYKFCHFEELERLTEAQEAQEAEAAQAARDV